MKVATIQEQEIHVDAEVFFAGLYSMITGFGNGGGTGGDGGKGVD